jgi:2'-5' RNA ligase
VIWAGLEGDLVFLRDLASAVDAEASDLGFPREARDFAPHLTLGRVRAGLRPDDHRLLLDFLGQAKLDALGEFSPDTLNLIASELRPTGAMYQRLFTVPIAHKENASGSY